MQASLQFSIGWRHACVAVVLLFAALLSIYGGTVSSMVTIWWRAETFTHGFLVLPISLWLIWRMRFEVITRSPRPSYLSLAVLVIAAFSWLLGKLVAVNAVTMFALVVMIVAIVPSVVGWEVTKALAFPLAYLFFAVPFGDVFMPQLMDWTADFTVAALRITGIPVFREGNQFVIPSGNWSVVEACSGVRYLLASLTVGTLFAYLNYRSNRRRLVFIAFSFMVPIVANWLRAYMIVMLGHFSGNKLAVGVDHLIYGWVFFGVFIFAMFMVGARWAEPVAIASVPIASTSQGMSQQPTAKVWRVASIFVLVLILPHLGLWIIAKNENLQPLVLPKLELTTSQWQLSSNLALDFNPKFENPSAQSNQLYAKASQQVGLYLGAYRNQTPVSKLVSSNNVLVTTRDAAWLQVGGEVRQVNLGDHTANFKSTDLRGIQTASQLEPSRLLVWQIYWINGSITANDYLAKVYGALYRLAGQGDDSAVIVVYALTGQVGGADAALGQFLAENYRAIDTHLRHARLKK